MISIIVPIYNSEKWLKRCVESLINQTYTHIEILLINDGSKDRSLEICNEYAKKDNRIIVIDKENEGVSATRNLGIKKAKGEFIQFVDSDDYIDEQMCEKLLNAVDNADLVLCGLKVWQRGVLLREPHLENGTYNLKESIDIYFKIRKINLGPCNKLYRREKILKGFRENLSLGEDTFFVLDYMTNVVTVSVIDDCLYNVVLDNDSSLNRSSKVDKIDLLIEQRITEEQFLIDIYGKECDLTQMYDCYLLLMHAWFLQLVDKKANEFKKTANKYIKSDLLQTKIKGSFPDRFDYKIFKYLYAKKSINLIHLYFRLKMLILGRKK